MWASALKRAIEFVPFPSNLGASIRVLVEMVVNSPSLMILLVIIYEKDSFLVKKPAQPLAESRE